MESYQCWRTATGSRDGCVDRFVTSVETQHLAKHRTLMYHVRSSFCEECTSLPTESHGLSLSCERPWGRGERGIGFTSRVAKRGQPFERVWQQRRAKMSQGKLSRRTLKQQLGEVCWVKSAWWQNGHHFFRSSIVVEPFSPNALPGITLSDLTQCGDRTDHC